MSLSHELVGNVILNGAVELLLFAPNSAQVILESAKIIPASSAGKEAVNYTTLQLIDKGAAGTGTDIVASIKTEDVAEGVALVSNVKQNISPSSPYTLSNALTIKKIDNGTAVNLGACVVILKVRET